MTCSAPIFWAWGELATSSGSMTFGAGLPGRSGGRRPAWQAAGQGRVRPGAAMVQLDRQLGVMPVSRLYDRCQTRDEAVLGKTDLALVRRPVGPGDSSDAGDDQPDAPFRLFLVVGADRLAPGPIFFAEPSAHGRHDKPVAQDQRAYAALRRQMRITVGRHLVLSHFAEGQGRGLQLLGGGHRNGCGRFETVPDNPRTGDYDFFDLARG